MATRNTGRYEIEEAPTSRDSYLLSASCSFLQDLTDIYINPEESVSTDAEVAPFQNDFYSETPNKYPNAPHSSPIESQDDSDSPVFNEELVKCLNKLPIILLSLEDGTKDSSAEMTEDMEDSSISCFEASSSTESDDGNRLQYRYGNIDKGYSVKVLAVSSDISREGKAKSTKTFSTNINNNLDKFNFLRVDSLIESNSVFHSKSTLSDDTSIIANCASDASNLSLEDVESVSSDGNSSCASRDRIEFEALALDSTTYPSTNKKFQHWRTRGRNKRALSLDEMIPSKILHTTDFSTTLFELNI